MKDPKEKKPNGEENEIIPDEQTEETATETEEETEPETEPEEEESDSPRTSYSGTVYY